MIEFTLTQRNAQSAHLVAVRNPADNPIALISIGLLGDSDTAQRKAAAEWVRKACEQFAAVNPDEPFPFK